MNEFFSPYIQFDEGEYFNPDFIVVDRILDKAITKDEDSDEMVTHYLVKWASLPYEESTWELANDVDKGKKKIYEKFSKLPSKSERQVRRRWFHNDIDNNSIITVA